VSVSPVFNKGLHTLVPSEQSCVEKGACGSVGNAGQTSLFLWVIHSQCVCPGEEVRMMGRSLEMMYLRLACLLSSSLFFCSLARISGFPQSCSKAVGAG